MQTVVDFSQQLQPVSSRKGPVCFQEYHQIFMVNKYISLFPSTLHTVCACNALGTIGGSGTVCDLYTGQCPCQPGVTGRMCEMCELGYVDFTIDGCTSKYEILGAIPGRDILLFYYRFKVVWA